MSKVKNIGDECSKCGTEVVERTSKKKKTRVGQRYCYSHYMYCTNCKTIYFHERYKVMLEEDNERLTAKITKKSLIHELQDRVEMLEIQMNSILKGSN